MNNETEMVMILWEKIKDLIPPKAREEVASQILYTISDFLDEVNLNALEGEDEVLDVVINAITSNELEVIVEIDEDDSWDDE